MAGSRKIPKGYYPLCIYLPPNNTESYIYFKEHKSKGNDNSKTLFVTNVPYIRGIKTSLLLKSIFNRFGDVDDVTVIKSTPNENMQSDDGLILKDDTYFWLDDNNDEGKFAHVSFASKDDLKNAIYALYGKMGKKGVTIHDEEIHNLKSQSNTEESTLLNRYKQSKISRDALMEECNKVISKFQQLEEEEKRQQSLDLNQPDNDGFITVTYNTKNISKVGTKTNMETSITEAASNNTQAMMKRRKNSKRSRHSHNKDKMKGSNEMNDFYRFQMRDSRKRNLDDLKSRFEEDLMNVKKLKGMKQYRPF